LPVPDPPPRSPISFARESAGVAAALGVLAIALTWPQAAFLGSRVAAHHDATFSIWRLAWFAHQAPRAPLHLLDANIFYPTSGTLTHSDPTLLESIVAAPLFWIGASPVLIYNLLVLASFPLAGLGLYWLARRLGCTPAASLVGATIYAFVPYRFEHYFHLELLWSAWIPWSLAALHALVRDPAPRRGLKLGLFVTLQIAASMYYGLFLVVTLALFAPVVAAAEYRAGRDGAVRLLRSAALAALLVGAVGAAYRVAFSQAVGQLGGRSLVEVADYSARPYSYLAAGGSNRLYGNATNRFYRPELALFPGVTAMLLVAVGLWPPVTRTRLAYLGLLVFSTAASMGMHTPVYRLLYFLPPFQNVRVPGRFGAIVTAAIAILAAFGAARVLAVIARASARRAALVAMIAVLAAEYASAPPLMTVALRPPPAYIELRKLRPGPVVEFPMPAPDALPGPDPSYEYWSTFHWFPLLNGYSGYYTRQYLDLLEALRRPRSREWLAMLDRVGTRYALVHLTAMPDPQALAVLDILRQRSDWLERGSYSGAGDVVWMFERLP
jgi:hypothetical protein